MPGSLKHPLIQYGINPPSVPTLVIGDGVQVVVTLKDFLDFDQPLNAPFADYGKVISVGQTLFSTGAVQGQTICGFRPGRFGRENEVKPGEAEPETVRRIEVLWDTMGVRLILDEALRLEELIKAELERRKQPEAAAV